MTPDSLTLTFTKDDGTEMCVEYTRLKPTEKYTRTEFEVRDDGGEHRVIGSEQVESLDVDARMPDGVAESCNGP